MLMRRSFATVALSLALVLLVGRDAFAQDRARTSAVVRELFSVRLLPSTGMEKPHPLFPPLAPEVQGVSVVSKSYERLRASIADNSPSAVVKLSQDLIKQNGSTLFPLPDGRHISVWLLTSRFLDEVIQEHEPEKDTNLPAMLKDSSIDDQLKTLRNYIEQNLYRDDVLPQVVKYVELSAASGRYAQALQMWINLLQVKHTIDLENPNILLTLSMCWESMGQIERAKTLLQGTSKLYAGSKVTLGGKEMPVEAAVGRLLSEIEKRPVTALSSDWPMYWGNGRRSSVASGEITGNVAWKAITPAGRDLMEAEISIPGESRLAMPSAAPLTREGIVYARSAGAVTAYDAVTGSVMWGYKAAGYSGNSAEPPHLRAFSAEDCWPLAVGKGWLIWAPRTDKMTWPVLMGLAATPGQNEPRVLWTRGDEKEQDFNLKGMCFSGQISVVGDKAYVLAINDEDVYTVICIDGMNGSIVWQTAIGKSKNSGAQNYGVRALEIAGMGVAADDAMVVCTAGDGILRALDSHTGATRWVHCMQGGVTPRSVPFSAGTPVQQPSPVIAGTKMLVIFPYGETQKLICVEAYTAELRWSTVISKTAIIGAIDQEKVYLYDGKTEKGIRAIGLDSGFEVWKKPLEEPLYKPAVFGDKLLCPTSEGLVVIDTKIGRAISDKPVSYRWSELGVHMPYPFEPVSIVPTTSGRMIVASSMEMVCLFSKEFEAGALSRLAANRENALAVYDLALVAVAKGDTKSAMDNFQKIIDIARLPKQQVPGLVLDDARQRLAEFLNSQKTPDKVITLFEKCELQKPAGYVDALVASKRNKEAAAELYKLVETATDEHIYEPEPGYRTVPYPSLLKRLAGMVSADKSLLQSIPETSRGKVEKIAGMMSSGKLIPPSALSWELKKSPFAPSFLGAGLVPLKNGLIAFIRNGRVEVRDNASGEVVWRSGLSMLGARFAQGKPGAVIAENDFFGPSKYHPQQFDKFEKVDGSPVTSSRDLAMLVARMAPGKVLKTEVVRGNTPLGTYQTMVFETNEQSPPWMQPLQIIPIQGGAQLLVRWPNGVCRTYESATGKVLATFSIGGIDGNVFDMAVIGDKLVASWTDVPQPHLKLGVFDVATGREIWSAVQQGLSGSHKIVIVSDNAFFKSGNFILQVNPKALNAAEGIAKIDASVAPDAKIAGYAPGKLILSWSVGLPVSPEQEQQYRQQVQMAQQRRQPPPPPLKTQTTYVRIWDLTGDNAKYKQIDGLLLLAPQDSEKLELPYILVQQGAKVSAIKIDDQKVLWEAQMDARPRSLVASSGDTIFLAAAVQGPSEMAALEKNTGKLSWKVAVNNPSSLHYLDGMLFVSTFSPGAQNWEWRQGGRVAVNVPPENAMAVHNASNGEVVERHHLAGGAAPAIYSNGGGFLMVTPTIVRSFFPYVN